MTWLEPIPDKISTKHKCPTPMECDDLAGPDRAPWEKPNGSQWLCDCGRVWQVRGFHKWKKLSKVRSNHIRKQRDRIR